MRIRPGLRGLLLLIVACGACPNVQAAKKTDAGPKAGDLIGRVMDIGTGQPLGEAMVTLMFPSTTPGPSAVTVFSDASGVFRFSGLPSPLPEAMTIAAGKLGFRQVEPADGRLHLERVPAGQRPQVLLQSVGDIADSVPASAWLSSMPAGDAHEKAITITSCTSCHQFPSPRVRQYAAQIESVSGGPDGDRKAIEEWRKVVRHEAWRTVVKYMRPKHFAVFPLESPVNIDAIDWPTAINADFNFFSARQGDLIAKYLAENFPRNTATLPRDDYKYGAPLGVTSKTVIREYAFPNDALVREMVAAPDSGYFWGADVRRNMIVRLDGATGETKWFKPDYKGSTGPHTIVPDDSGHMWVSMIDNDQFSRFETKKEQWKLWTLRPSNLPDTAAMAGSAIVHDMSIDSRGHLARDKYGKVWVTLVGSNQLGTLDPDTGEVAFYETHHVDGFSAINHLIYGCVISNDRKTVWYSQLNGVVGSVDAKTHKLDKVIPFTEGAGPRRMSLDNKGVLWVPLFGTGQIAKVDMDSGKVVQTIDLPDRGAAPYAVSWDEKRKVVWVANANSDVIYRLDPKTSATTVIPLPRKMAYLRQIGIDQKNGRLVASYGNYPEGSGPSMGVVIDVGD
jgi:streptogramin lyase/cytochrome c2|nr:SMP-30/gluconolactonase/LRE family protein [Panacagrimonas sp.]